MIRSDKFASAQESQVVAIVQASEADHVRSLQRHIAEAGLRQRAAPITGDAKIPPQYSTKQLLHELRVHQIELEIQNETLRESQIALNAVGTRYFDLYDLAPIAYCTVNEQGLIWQANMAAAKLFGMERNALLNQPFSRYIFIDDQDIYYFFRQRLSSSGQSQSIELRLVRQDEMPFWADLTVVTGQDATGGSELRILLSDIGQRTEARDCRTQLRLALSDTNAELEHARAAADNANRDKSAYLVGIGRELNARLSAMLTASQSAKEDSLFLTPEQKRNIDQIECAGRRLLNLINENLDPTAVSAATTVSTEAASSIAARD